MTDARDGSLDALMARLAEGDRTAFTPVFRRLWPPMLQLCRGMLKNDSDALDAAQQAMEKLLVRASEYESTRPALPWALGIASWECRTFLRKQLRRRESPETAAPEPSISGDDEEHVQRQLIEVAVNAMGTLSDVDRETLISTFWDEAASVGGATLRKRRERAIVRLRGAFRRLYGRD